MKNILLKGIAVFVILFTLVSSCKKSEVTKDAYVDSYINSIVGDNGTPVYTMIHSAYSFSKISSVSVKGSSGSTTTLQNFNGDGFAFFMDVDDKSLYKSTIPAAESFTYNVAYSDGTTETKVNSVAGKSILPAQQLALSKEAINIMLKWKPVANVEAYKISISRIDSVAGFQLKENKLIYQSSYLVPKDATSDLSIPFATTSFPSDSYTDRILVGFKFEVASFIFEQGQDNFEAVSTASKIVDISKL